MRRRGYLDERPLEDRSNEPPAQGALDACAAIAMGRGSVATLPRAGKQGALEERLARIAMEERRIVRTLLPYVGQ